MATGDTLCSFTPLNSAPPASNYATLDTRNTVPVLNYDAATEEAAYFIGILPRRYGGNGITVYIKWMAATATSGDVVWGTSFEAEGTDLDADSFAAESTATGTANGTSGIETTTAPTHTNGAQIDSLAVGNRFRLKVARKAASGSDTMTGDAQITAIEVKES